MRRIPFPLVVAVALGLAPVAASVERPPAAAIDAVFARYDHADTPGCSVAVIAGGAVAYENDYGAADPALGVPMTSATTFWVPYSEARVFVALAVAMLARDGAIAFDDPVARHLPSLPAYAADVTIAQLLHHTSGLADYGVLAGPGFELGDRMSEDEFLRILARWGKLQSVPGRGRMYSNTDYALLKMLVEHVSGMSLHDYLEDRLLAPAGMASTRIGADPTAAPAGRALFHEVRDDGFHRLLRYRVSPVGGIAVTTSRDDIVRFERALRDPERGLAPLLASLQASAPADGAAATGPRDRAYDFGMHVHASGEPARVEFNGVGGYRWLVRVPEADLAVATLCNAYAGMDTFGRDVARLFVAPAATPPTGARVAARPAIALPVAALARHAGTYRSADGALTMDLAVVDGALAMTPRGPGPSVPALVPVADGEFEARVGDLLHAFVFTADGAGGDSTVLAIREVESGDAAAPLLRRFAPWRPDAATLATYAGTYAGENVEGVLHVRVRNGDLLLATRGFPEAALAPQDAADRFRLPQHYAARFERDAEGRVVALVLDANRVQGLRYRRE